MRSMPLIADERIPLKKLITHRIALDELQPVLEAIEKGQKYQGKEIVKAVVDPLK